MGESMSRLRRKTDLLGWTIVFALVIGFIVAACDRLAYLRAIRLERECQQAGYSECHIEQDSWMDYNVYWHVETSSESHVDGL